jgi:hypothetical protein
MPDKKSVLRQCLICDKKFFVRPSHVRLGWGKYCSLSCRHESQKKGKYVACHWCKKRVWRKPQALKRSKSGYLFCDRKCSMAWKNSELRAGSNHPLWNGGKASYRHMMEKRGEGTHCRRCGITDKRVLIVHHIDHNRKNNVIENLLWLCRNCHYLEHEGKTV